MLRLAEPRAPWKLPLDFRKTLTLLGVTVLCVLGALTWSSAPDLRRRLLFGLTGPQDADGEQCKVGKVCDLTVKNFLPELQGETTLVKFFAPWCGHCKHLEPEYKGAADMLSKDGMKVMQVNVDDGENKSIAKKFNVTGYPTMLLFKNGRFAGKYTGARKAGAIADWLRVQNSSWFSMARLKHLAPYIGGAGLLAVLGYQLYHWVRGDADSVEAPKPEEKEQVTDDPKIKDAPPPTVDLSAADQLPESEGWNPALMLFAAAVVLLLIVAVIYFMTRTPVDDKLDAAPEYDIENPAPRNSS